MALNPATLGAALAAKAASASLDPTSAATIWVDIATIILAHIATNGVVAVTVPAGALVAPGGGGPVTGATTGTGTIS